MKTHLLFRDRDFPWNRALPDNADALIQDLELTTLFSSMADGDSYTYDVAQRVVLAGIDDPTITFRQNVLNDCLNHPAQIKILYELAVSTVEGSKRVGHFILRDHPGMILSHSIQVLEYLIAPLKRLRAIADGQREQEYSSEGLTTFFKMLTAELDDDYFAVVADHLKRLRFRSGVVISAELGQGNHGRNYVLRSPAAGSEGWWQRLTSRFHDVNSFVIADRDEAGARALTELQERGINLVADALAQATDHILSFFHMMRAELAFYVGCINLRDQLGPQRELYIPGQSQPGRPSVVARDLCDVVLALRRPQEVIGNDVEADGRSLILITGANQGGKSTFLRSLGVAQLMFQCGMFVTARQYTASTCSGTFTHYKREEDSTMNSGKLDEELARMSEIVDHLRPGSLVLFNESFAATNEREGSEIARQVVDALRDSGVAVWFVTHLFHFAHSLHVEQTDSATALFLRAERQTGGRRTFHVVEGEPLPTSYGEDLYQEIFHPESPSTAAPEHHTAALPARTGNA